MIKQKPNTIILFDIDHTIFNTHLYRKKLYENLAKEIGADVKYFTKTARSEYKKLRKTTYYLDPDVFLKTILAHFAKSTELKKLKSVFWDSKLYESCIYKDVKETFSLINQRGLNIGIFSTGDMDHQKIKIESLKEFLSDNHIYISKDKFKIIKDTFEIYKEHHAFLVDDFPQILESAEAYNKDIFTVFIKRKKSHPDLIIPDNFKPDATITNLKQLVDIIEANN